MYKAKVTSKGQLTLPKKLRDQIGLETGDYHCGQTSNVICQGCGGMITAKQHIIPEFLNRRPGHGYSRKTINPGSGILPDLFFRIKDFIHEGRTERHRQKKPFLNQHWIKNMF